MPRWGEGGRQPKIHGGGDGEQGGSRPWWVLERIVTHPGLKKGRCGDVWDSRDRENHKQHKPSVVWASHNIISANGSCSVPGIRPYLLSQDVSFHFKPFFPGQDSAEKRWDKLRGCLLWEGQNRTKKWYQQLPAATVWGCWWRLTEEGGSPLVRNTGEAFSFFYQKKW